MLLLTVGHRCLGNGGGAVPPFGGYGARTRVCIDMEGQIGQKKNPLWGFMRLYAVLVVYSVPFPVAGGVGECLLSTKQL